MDRQAYVARVFDHYEHPRHKHPMGDADASFKGGNPFCGDLITIYLKVGPDERVAQISFEGEGCTVTQAGGSFVVELAAGMTLDEVMALGPAAMVEAFGEEILRSRPRCALLALETLQAAVAQYRRSLRRGAAPDGA